MRQQTTRNIKSGVWIVSPTPIVTLFRTPSGSALVGDSLDLLAGLPPDSVDLVVTSPPFALLRPKSYGNADQQEYVEWLCGFAPHLYRVLKPTGSYVLDLGGELPARHAFPVAALGADEDVGERPREV